MQYFSHTSHKGAKEKIRVTESVCKNHSPQVGLFSLMVNWETEIRLRIITYFLRDECTWGPGFILAFTHSAHYSCCSLTLIVLSLQTKAPFIPLSYIGIGCLALNSARVYQNKAHVLVLIDVSYKSAPQWLYAKVVFSQQHGEEGWRALAAEGFFATLRINTIPARRRTLMQIQNYFTLKPRLWLEEEN